MIAAAAGGAPRSHGTMPLRPGYSPPAITVLARTETSRTIVVGSSYEASEGTYPRVVQLGTVHLRVRFRYFSLFRVLTSHSTMATLQLLRIESAPLPFTAPLAPWPCRFPSRFAFRRQCEILKRLCGRACSPATAPAPSAPCASSSEHHWLQTGNLVGFQCSERRGCLQHLRG